MNCEAKDTIKVTCHECNGLKYINIVTEETYMKGLAVRDGDKEYIWEEGRMMTFWKSAEKCPSCLGWGWYWDCPPEEEL